MYHNGKGVLQDYKTAVKWYTLSAEQGIAIAQYDLGVMYENGNGVLQDYVKTHMWYNICSSIASNSHNNFSYRHLALVCRGDKDNLAKETTPYQIEKAQDLARECVAKNYKGC